MKFLSYMFGVEYDDQSVAKYELDDGSLMLQLEIEGERVKNSQNMFFADQAALTEYLDGFISDEDGMQGNVVGLKQLIDRFEFENKNSEYSARYESKRGTKRVNLAFYLDDDRERAIYEQLNDSGNKKQTIIEALANHFER